MKKIFTSLSILCLLLMACKTKKVTTPEISLSDKQSLVFLDSTQASQVVIVDQEENFFDLINVLDMKIQMKRNYPEGTNRAVILEDYKKFLQEDVRSFSPTEKAGLQKVFQDAFGLCEKLNDDIFPQKLQLIKSAGGPYGVNTFYTRDHSIVIPEGLLGEGKTEMLLDVALHEIFHIYSRYHPEKKKQLYQLIGFKPVEKELLALPDSLKRRMLINPDGIDYGYLIKLSLPEGKTIRAVPLITSTRLDFDPAHPTFFSYLKFDLYQTESPFVQRIKVNANNDGTSTINFQEIPNFFEQIKDNTEYIIHPDEIMADNFVWVATRQAFEQKELPLSAEGNILLNQVEEILRE